MSRRSCTRWLLERAALVLFGLILAIGCLEILLRFSSAWTPVPRPLRHLPRIERPSDLAAPNQHAVHRYVEFRTNRHGFRGPEYESAPPQGTFRILLAGDSVAMGHGVRLEDTYGARLAEALAMRDPERRYEVVNIALSGAHLGHILNRLRSAMEVYDAHLIVYGFTINDIEGKHYRRSGTPELRPGRGRWLQVLYDQSAVARFLLDRWVMVRLARVGRGSGVPPYLEELERNYFQNRQAWVSFVQRLDRLRRIGEERQLCVVLFLHTHLLDLADPGPLDRIYRRVSDTATARGIPVVDSRPFFRETSLNRLRLSALDPHPSSAGHARLAEALLEGLEELEPRCWH